MKLFFITYLIITNLNFAQFVDYNEIEGDINKNSFYKNEIGKYNGFEISFNKGEVVNILVSSNNFMPSLALIEPNGSIFKISKSNKNFASIFTTIPYSGIWYIYVIGNKNDKGNFILRYAIGTELEELENFDFCSGLNFLITHANANFLLISYNLTNYKIDYCKNLLIDNKGKLIIELFENKIAEVKNNLFNCLPDWRLTNNNLTLIEPNAEEIEIILLEQENKLIIEKK